MIVWLATYPRSGNTFARTVLNEFLGIKTRSVYEDAEFSGNPALAEVVGHIAGRALTQELPEWRSQSTWYAIKTHDLPTAYMSPDDYVIVILRDGRDATASYFHYQLSIAGRKDFSLSDVITGHSHAGTWGAHTAHWLRAPFRHKLITRYELIISEPGKFAREVGAFLGVPLQNGQLRSFEEMQQLDPRFFRAGRVGSWQEDFSAADEALFEIVNAVAMQIAGYATGTPTPQQIEGHLILWNRLHTWGTAVKLEAARLELQKIAAKLEAARLELQKKEEMLKAARVELQRYKRRYEFLMRYSGLAMATGLLKKAGLDSPLKRLASRQ